MILIVLIALVSIQFDEIKRRLLFCFYTVKFTAVTGLMLGQASLSQKFPLMLKERVCVENEIPPELSTVCCFKAFNNVKLTLSGRFESATLGILRRGCPTTLGK